MEKPPPDELYGKRIHGWILILPNNTEEVSEITEPFFIEVTTGVRHEIDWPNFLSISSVWNNANYWVNIQDTSLPPGKLDYNLYNLDKWEHILAGARRAQTTNLVDDENESALQEQKHMDVPEPWSLRIIVTYHGKKATLKQNK